MQQAVGRHYKHRSIKPAGLPYSGMECTVDRNEALLCYTIHTHDGLEILNLVIAINDGFRAN